MLLDKQILQEGPLSLNAVLISSDRRVAVINGRIYRVGDDVYGNKIASIDANSVQLDGAGGKITLFLFNNPIKQAVSNN